MDLARLPRTLARRLVPCLVVIALLAPAAPAARDDDEGLQRSVDAAIERGVAYLRSQQGPDGAWGPYARSGATALALYALLASGVERDDPAVRAALGPLAEGDAYVGTYDAACLLLALTTHDPVEHREWIEELAALLVSWQRAHGDWAYPEGGPDLSNTQFAALGLRAAAQAGVEVPARVWERLATGTMRYATPDGSFAYRASGRAGTDSMTAAGVATLAICDERLSAAGALSSKLAPALRRRRDRGLSWLAGRSPRFVEPTKGRASYYTLYGIERVGAFLELAELGGHDWYRAGAKDLCGGQAPNGGWGGPEGDPVSTAFALLFLRRATSARSATTGAETAGLARANAIVDPAADVRFVADGDDPTTFWITGFGPRVRERFTWPGEEGRGPRVVRVAYVAGGAVLAEVEGDPDSPAGGERFPARFRFREAGTHRVHARVVVMRPPHVTASGRTFDPSPIAVVSPELAVVVGEDRAVPVASARDGGRNLLADDPPRVDASSSAELGDVVRSARLAVDGRERTSWLAAPADEEPTLAIRPRRVATADRVLVYNALAVPYRPGAYARATEVEVRVNDGPPRTIAMPPDERLPGRLELEPGTPVRKLELRLRWIVQGEEALVGLSEVELLAD